LDLLIDLLYHLRRKEYVLVAAFESPGGLVTAELMVDALTHAEFVHIYFQKAGNDRF
jgi:hypothetical protein